VVDLFASDVTFAALRKAQQGLTQRSRLLAQNIANVNTPNYHRRDVNFTDEIAAALDHTKGDTRAERSAAVLDSVAEEVVEERLFYRPDMGGVDIDREMAEIAKNSLMSQATQQLMGKKIHQLRMVIKDGRI
jgi:flagellar basal-body rod protein FlgB